MGVWACAEANSFKLCKSSSGANFFNLLETERLRLRNKVIDTILGGSY